MRFMLWFQIRALEATIDGRDAIRSMVTDRLTLANMDLAQDRALHELRLLKRRYE